MGVAAGVIDRLFAKGRSASKVVDHADSAQTTNPWDQGASIKYSQTTDAVLVSAQALQRDTMSYCVARWSLQLPEAPHKHIEVMSASSSSLTEWLLLDADCRLEGHSYGSQEVGCKPSWGGQPHCLMLCWAQFGGHETGHVVAALSKDVCALPLLQPFSASGSSDCCDQE